MAPLLASALLSLVQGPYSPAQADEVPADAPVWIAGEAAREHSFTVTAEYRCPPDTASGMLLVSISDTAAQAEFGAGDSAGRRVLSLKVPGGQLQGLKPELFCPSPDANPNPHTTPARGEALRLKSRFTAQGALLCRTAAGKKTSVQASLALDAWVRCGSSSADQAAPP